MSRSINSLGDWRPQLSDHVEHSLPSQLPLKWPAIRLPVQPMLRMCLPASARMVWQLCVGRRRKAHAAWRRLRWIHPAARVAETMKRLPKGPRGHQRLNLGLLPPSAEGPEEHCGQTCCVSKAQPLADGPHAAVEPLLPHVHAGHGKVNPE